MKWNRTFSSKFWFGVLNLCVAVVIYKQLCSHLVDIDGSFDDQTQNWRGHQTAEVPPTPTRRKTNYSTQLRLPVISTDILSTPSTKNNVFQVNCFCRVDQLVIRGTVGLGGPSEHLVHCGPLEVSAIEKDG